MKSTTAVSLNIVALAISLFAILIIALTLTRPAHAAYPTTYDRIIANTTGVSQQQRQQSQDRLDYEQRQEELRAQQERNRQRQGY